MCGSDPDSFMLCVILGKLHNLSVPVSSSMEKDNYKVFYEHCIINIGTFWNMVGTILVFAFNVLLGSLLESQGELFQRFQK